MAPRSSGDGSPGPIQAELQELLAELDKPADEQDPARVRALQARVTLNEMFQFVGLLDLSGTLLDCNQTVLDAAGIDRDQVIGLPVWETHWWAVDDETVADLKDAVARARQGEHVRYDVKVKVDPSGGLRWIDFSCKPVVDGDGEVVLLLPEGRDVHEQKLFEQELAEANDELERMNRQLREMDELKSQFFANVSHELRTPLSLILGPLERLLASDATEGDQIPELEVARRNALQLRDRVNDLLDVARLEAGGLDPEYHDLDLATLVRLTASNFEVMAEDQGIDLTVETPDELPAQVDPDKLQRVLANLLSNALKFTPAGGTVRCTLTRHEAPEADSVELRVADSGPGIPEEERDRVFERFRQVDGAATRQHEGTGLGLAIVHEFLELHGGSIHVRDSPEGGALFVARLPRWAPEGAEVTRWTGQAPQPEPVPTPGSTPEHPVPRATHVEDRPTVLVVEDNPEMRRFVATTLAHRYNVETAADGREGLDKALRIPPDLILTDIMMPRMSGDQLVRAVRSEPQLSGVPIVLLTAKADQDLRVELLEQGAQDHIMKPFSQAELQVRVGNLVDPKIARDLLQAQLSSESQDLSELAETVTERLQELEGALEVARDDV